MKWLNNLKTRTKLLAGFIVMAFIVILLGVGSISGISQMNQAVETLYADKLVPVIALKEITGELADIKVGAMQIVHEPDAAKRQYIFTDVMEDEKAINELLAKHAARDLTPEERTVFEELKSAWQAYNESRLDTYNWALQGDFAKAEHNLTTNDVTKFDAVDETLETLVSLYEKTGKELRAEAGNDYRHVRNVAIGTAIIAILAALGFGIILAKIIANPLQKSVRLAEAIAGGDLTRTFESAELKRADELGTLAQALQAMVASLKTKIQESAQQAELARQETQRAQKATQEAQDTKQQVERANQGLLQAAGQVEAVVEQLTSASEELAAQVEQASRGSEEQRARTGETATAMEEMNASVLEVAKNASQAAQASDQAQAKAVDGAKVVSAAVGAIHKVQGQAQDMKNKIKELGQQAEQIGRIMNVIDDIADQTNLLALNAAIEAARAGDAGRGFAVVADEVRKLAEKTMNATKEVGEAIAAIQAGTRANIQGMDQSVAAIAEATKLANKSGEALQEILALSDQAADQVRSIAAAAEEQSTTSEQINRGVEDINRIAAETSEVMNQSAQAVSELAKQAQTLQNLVQQLKQQG